jgi:glycosyltransferase involved in cell wall biosynthesis
MTKPVRVLHVSEVSWGGVVSLLRQFIPQQIARGHHVGLLSPPISPAIEGVAFRPWSINRRRINTYSHAVRELRRAIDEFDPDVVHLHSFMAGFMGRLPLATGSLPVVYQPHAWSFNLHEGRSFRRALEAWERYAGRRTKVIVTNCQDEMDEGHDAGVTTPGRVIGVAVDTDLFTEVDEAEKQRLREKLGVEVPNMLLVIGRLARQKGQDLLVSEWELDAPPETELVLVGPGDTEALQALAPKEWGRSIRAIGEDADVRPWLWACDALLLSSRYEAVGVTVAEALASGRPIVATDVNGVGEVIDGGDLPPAGRIVPVGDMAALLSESEYLLQNPDLAAEMARIARIRAEKMFNVKVVVDRLDEAYEEAICAVKIPRQRTSLEPNG